MQATIAQQQAASTDPYSYTDDQLRAAAQHNAQQVNPLGDYGVPDPMPSHQLMTEPFLPQDPAFLGVEPAGMSSENIGSASVTNAPSVQYEGTSENAFMTAHYRQDPGQMTLSTVEDTYGLQSMMPNIDGVLNNNVDPSTGLPVYTADSLNRANLLGGQGPQSFLRQVVDPMAGYARTVGRNFNGTRDAMESLRMKREQFNAARIGDCDPVLFNVGEFAYM